MSGLLDKAKKTVVASQPATITTTTTTTTTSDVLVSVIDAENGETNIGVLVGMQVVGVIGLLVSMFLLVQTGWLYATLFDYLLAILVMAVGWAIFNGSDYLSAGLSQSKMIITAVGFASLFIVTIVGTIFMNAGGGVTIASVELDGTDNEIDLSFFGPSGMSYTVEVIVDGSVQYSHDGEINIDRGSHSIPIDQFWAG
ncbi:MAG: hypothetical protein L7S49_06915, partial [Candidatus Poseidoniaceae archaeon]|nr:hypothetical protein [Candidatus Poseidoniaceae archaeon]